MHSQRKEGAARGSRTPPATSPRGWRSLARPSAKMESHPLCKPYLLWRFRFLVHSMPTGAEASSRSQSMSFRLPRVSCGTSPSHNRASGLLFVLRTSFHLRSLFSILALYSPRVNLPALNRVLGSDFAAWVRANYPILRPDFAPSVLVNNFGA